MKKLIKGENDLLTKAPQLAEEWDYEKNEKLPSEYAFKSNVSVFWKCKKCGYEYKAKISNRAIGRGCPCCAGRVVVLGVNDLTTTHPQLAAEWHPTKNGALTPEQVTYGRTKKVWWLCPEGHTYQATILHRSSGTNCPKCNAGRQTSFAEQAVFFYVKKLYPDAVSRYKEIFNNQMELDIYIPSIRLGIEYDGMAWHKESRFEKEKEKYEICRKNNIKLLRIKEKSADRDKLTADRSLSLGGITALYEHRNLTQIIQALLDDIDPETNFWTRKKASEIHSSVKVNIPRDEMEIRSYMTKLKNGSFEERFPDLAKEWHPAKNGTLTPDKVSPFADIQTWWICPNCGYEYKATIGHRSVGTGCPKCGIKKSALARSKGVQMIDMETKEIIKTFASISDASRQMGISSGNISAVCKGGGRKQAGGYIWRYAQMDN